MSKEGMRMVLKMGMRQSFSRIGKCLVITPGVKVSTRLGSKN